jgi:hypothetical protein
MTQPSAPEQVTVYFSFGHGQTDPTTGKHLLDHYVTIVGPSYEACRAAMFASKYGDRWAFDYIAGEPQAEAWIPRWIEHERIVLPADYQLPPECSPECEAQDADRPHLFTCPVRRAAEDA